MEACRTRAWIALASCLALGADPASAQPIPLEVRDGRCTFTLKAESDRTAWWLVLGAARPSSKPFPIDVRSETADAFRDLPRSEEEPPSTAWTELRREQLARWRRSVQAAEGAQASSVDPPAMRRFWMLQRDRDLGDPSSYAEVRADLVVCGKRCTAYVDQAESAEEQVRTLAHAAVSLFDREVHPWMAERCGVAADVDRDGRFCIFLTQRVAQMEGTAGSLQGFVRGSDFFRDLEPPFGNRCDMMYLSTRVAPGPALKALLAHEYAHAAMISERVLNPRLPNAERKDEESWLSEGLAHLVEGALVPESRHLDHRISAYLNDPARHRLIAADYFAERIWRDPGTRGAAIRFLTWCGRSEPDLIRRLGCTSHRGTSNLEIAMQRPFASLFREWSIAQLDAGAPDDAGREADRGLLPFRLTARSKASASDSPFLLAGPRFEEVRLGRHQGRQELAGTAVAYLRLHADGPGIYAVDVACPPGAELQATLIAGGDPGLRLAAERHGDRLALVVEGGGDRLEVVDAAVEWSKPGPRLFGQTPVRRIPGSAWKGLQAEVDLDSSWRGEDLTVKVVGRCGRGRTAVAWATAPAERSPNAPKRFE